MNLVKSYKEQIINVSENNFEQLALSIFNLQSKENPVYSAFLKNVRKDPLTVSTLSEIPFLPVSFFKSHKVILNKSISKTVFYSSGTTGMSRSEHHISDPDWYKEVSLKTFEQIFGPLSESVVLAYLPSYQENPSSSLIFMVDHFIKETQNHTSSFVNRNNIIAKLDEARKSGLKVFLFAVTYALLDLAEEGTDLSNITIIETGGMKGKRKEITREELYKILSESAKATQIRSEYGMTELLSQAYSLEKGVFHPAPWMKVLSREINDPWEDNSGERTGVLKIIDLANIESCSFIETEDLGFVSPNKTFTVLGRMDNSEARGCNFLYAG